MKQQSKETVLVLANAVTLAAGVVNQLAGDQVGATVAGSQVTQESLVDLIGSHVQSTLAHQNRLHQK